MVDDAISYAVRTPAPMIATVDLVGELTAASEAALMAAYHVATTGGARTIILDFTRLEYMSSSGIGVLVTVLVRASRQRQTLLASGMSDHHRQILELIRLDESIGVHDTEREAVAAARARAEPAPA